jgi:hypothetical protein
MSLTVEPEVEQAAAAAAKASGLIVRSGLYRGGTELDVACEEGIRTVRIRSLPDEGAARDATSMMRRVLSVRFDIDDAGARCVVRGIGHRAPREIPVSLAAGLGLVRRGLVAVVVWNGR